MARWTQPYQRGARAAGLVVAALSSMVALVVVCATYLVPGMAPTERGANWAAVLVPIAFFTLWVAMAWRIALVGVSVGDRGIRVRSVLRTQVIEWTDVHRVVAVDDPTFRNRAVVVVTRDGTRLPILWRHVFSFRPTRPAQAVSAPGAVVEQLAADLDAMAAARTGRLRL
jgi:hypothetical protein